MNQILEKISKTLRLSANNSNENEAQSAILAAQRLMAKYHITQEEINDFLNECDSKDSQVIEEKADKEMNNEKWKKRLMITIAKNFRCDVYYHGGKLVIVGSKEDILIAKRVYLYAKHAILNSFKIFYKENYDLSFNDDSFRNKCKRDYAYGFINGLSQKFEEQKEKSEMALVVVNPEVKTYFENINFTGVYRGRATKIESNYCFREGKYKGRTLADIDSQMEGAS